MATPLAILLALVAAATVRNDGAFSGPDYAERVTLAELSEEAPNG
jgi:hypothetical protein